MSERPKRDEALSRQLTPDDARPRPQSRAYQRYARSLRPRLATARRKLSARAHPVSTPVTFVLVSAALALSAAGCGEGSPGAAGASVVPASSQVFVSLDTSFDSANWEAGRALLGKFPDGDRAVAWFMNELGGQGIDFERDVKPALGPETDFVALELSGKGKVVGLTQPDDPAKLKALLAKSDEPLVSREIDGWTAFSDSEANLDEFESMQKDGTLDSNIAYQKVSGQVADDALAHVYVAASALQSTPYAALFGPDAPSLALSLDPQEDGIHLEGAASPATGDLFSDEFSAELPDRVPAGVLLYVDANDLETQLSALRNVLADVAPTFERDIGRAEAEIGVSLDEDVFPLFSAESALYVRPGFPIPEVTLVTQVDDEQGALAVLDKLAGEVAEYYGAAELHSTDIDGVPAKELAVNPLFSVYYAAFDGNLVVTTSRQGITDLKAEDGRLADDEAFKKATEAAGMPAETTGFLYVDLAKAVPVLTSLAGLSGTQTPDSLERNLEPLHSLVLYGERDGDVAKFVGLLSIQ
jgi:Protein of unknown function (DUF3352)